MNEEIKNICTLLYLGFVHFLAIVGIICTCESKTDISSPVEKIDNKSDSLVKVNDSIVVIVNHLDSIKNAEIIEVRSLDNDSTLSLFYKLVKEEGI